MGQIFAEKKRVKRVLVYLLVAASWPNVLRPLVGVVRRRDSPAPVHGDEAVGKASANSISGASNKGRGDRK